MKVLFFIPHLGPGGAQKVFVDLANYMHRQGYEVTVLVLKKGRERDQDLNEEIEFIELKISKMLFALPRLIRFLKESKHSVAITTLDYASVTFLAARKFANSSIKTAVRIPVHISSNVRYTDSLNVKIARFLTPHFFPKADVLIGVSKEIIEDLNGFANLNGIKTTSIYNPVSESYIKKQSLEEVDDEWFNSKNRIILSAGRLWIQKDFITLIKAFKIADTPDNVKLVIIGDGPQREELEQLIEDLSLTNKVRLAGFKNNPYKYMANSEIYILSSIFEGMPNSLIQAMFCGCKLISTKCPSGPKEVLDNGKYGILVEPQNVSEMADAIKTYLEKERINIDTKWKSQFTEQVVLEKYENILKSIND